MSKGSARRPAAIGEAEMERRWEAAFGKRQPQMDADKRRSIPAPKHPRLSAAICGKNLQLSKNNQLSKTDNWRTEQ